MRYNFYIFIYIFRKKIWFNTYAIIEGGEILVVLGLYD
jgi:hypothetical protein